MVGNFFMTRLSDIANREYTLSEIGKICGMSYVTVRKWYRENRFKDSLVLPKNKFLRVSYQNLIEFMEECKIPLDLLKDYHGLDELPELDS